MVKFSTDINANHSHIAEVNELGHGRTNVVAGHEHLIMNLEVKPAGVPAKDEEQDENSSHSHKIIPSSLRI